MIARVFREICRQHAERPALSELELQFSYTTLARRIDSLAIVLVGTHQLKPTNPVAIQLPNSADFAVSFFALMQLGSPAILLSTHWKGPEIQEVLNQVPVQAVISSRGLLPRWEETSLDKSVPRLAAEDFLQEHGSGTSRPCAQFPPVPAGTQPAIIFCTAGTTGRPKLVVRSHENLLANAANVAERLALQPGSRTLAVVPFYHANGFSNCLLLPLLSGSSIFLMRRFEPESLAMLVEQKQIEVLMGSPFIYEQLVEAGKGVYGSVHTALTSGAPLPPRVEQECRQHLGLRVRQLYGSSETGTIAIQPNRDGQPAGSVGVPLSRVEIRILGPNRLPLPAGTSGEIAVRSPAVMSGYWESGGLSRTGFQGDFFMTGDLGFLTGEGELVLQGRAKPVINVGGIKVDPEEIARVIREIPGVLGCKVYGVSHPVQTEIIAASIQCDPNKPVERKQVVEHCRQHLAEFKIPRQIFFSQESGDPILGNTGRI